MDAPPTSHPTNQTLYAHGQGQLDDRSAESVGQHLESCPACRRRATQLSADRSPGRIREAPNPSESPPPVGSSFPGISSVVGGTGSGPPPPVDSLPPGLAENPDYQVLRELGRGGMGVVYLAQNTLMGRKEVLKVVSKDLMERRTVSERFLREIRNAAQLHHPNIVTAYSAMRAGDRIVLAMEYVEGYDLAKLVKSQGPLPVAHACNFVYQAALGLQHAHERGMVHRDIKPGNLMLARQGKRAIIKVLDFGLAKATQEAPIDGGLTREGQMLGTPDYIAPEQSLDAQKADIRADIYSLGCTLYYLLSGGPPFQATSLYEILQAHHSRDALPLNLVRPEVPAELAALVAKMMAKEPGHRFQTPGEVAKAIKPFSKPGEAVVTGARADASDPASTVGGRGPTPVPQQTATTSESAPSPTVGKGARPTPLGRAPERIDLGQAEGLSEEEPAATKRAGAGLPWLWPTAAAGALILGVGIAWKLGVDTGQNQASVVPPGPSVAVATANDSPSIARAPKDDPVPPREDVRGIARAPSEGPPSSREVRTPLPARESQPDPASVPSLATAPKTAPPAAASHPNIPEPVAAPRPKVIGGDVRVEPKRDGVKLPLDIRHISVRSDVDRLANAGGGRPKEGFWPTLSAENLRAWQVGDPDHIEINGRGVYLSAGPSGNLLLTKQDGYKRCALKLSMTATKGTEAFLALRAHHGPDGWRAITARVIDEGGKIRVGPPSLNFQLPEIGKGRQDFAPEKTFNIKFDSITATSRRLVSMDDECNGLQRSHGQ